MSASKEQLLEKARLLEKKIELKEGLPHLYGWPWYKWAKLFFDSVNHMNFLVAANQISKSSTQIRKCIDWATDQSKWPKLWRTKPLQFWYLYPAKDVATIEFDKKWIPEFLPRGKFKDDPVYGWKAEYRHRDIFALHFHSGVSVYFKTYAQDAQHLQTGSCYAIFCDEELPEELFDELSFRLAATDGYFHMVFTATLGQQIWYETMELSGDQEKFPDAFKQQISLYDCLEYEDGSPSPWNQGRIGRLEKMCKSEAEKQRRVHGRFVKESGLKYPTFSKEDNTCKPAKLPRDWHIYGAVDIGSGGNKGGHPAAIAFVAVAPDFTRGVVFLTWRGDGLDTTAGDVLNKFIELRGSLKCTQQFYDWQSKDFWNLAQRIGETFTPAEKGHDIGEGILNTLFANRMLTIFVSDDDTESAKLCTELLTLTSTTPKNKSKDDLIDAVRYAVSKVPWDWSSIAETENTVKVEEQKIETPDQEFRRRGFDSSVHTTHLVDDELEAWNELYEV